MKTEKASNLCNFLNTSIKYFEYAVAKKEKELPNFIRLKNTLTEQNFNKMHQEFMTELDSNILEYRDYDIAYKYIKNSLYAFREWDGFEYEITSVIISNNHDVQFLLKLKLSIEKEINSIRVLFNDYYMHNSRLRMYFDGVISKKDQDKRKTKTPVPDENKPAFDEKFDFDKMMKECSTVATDTLSKIDFIHDRIFDFKQWQLKYDKEEAFKIKFSKHESDYIYTAEYYPKFEELCKLELQRLEKKLELEKKALTHKAIENNPIIVQQEKPSRLNWNSSDTDLIELVAAIYAKKSIKRTDGKELTQKALFEYFQVIFNIELKNISTNLTKAGNRKNGITPYLDKLKLAFENYVEEKEKKMEKRR